MKFSKHLLFSTAILFFAIVSTAQAQKQDSPPPPCSGGSACVSTDSDSATPPVSCAQTVAKSCGPVVSSDYHSPFLLRTWSQSYRLRFLPQKNRGADAEAFARGRSGQSRGAADYASTRRRSGPLEIEGELVAKSVVAGGSLYKVGERVFHQKFGYGLVSAVEGNKLTVEFDKAGQKKVIDAFVERA